MLTRRERERERDIYIYVYIYIHLQIYKRENTYLHGSADKNKWAKANLMYNLWSQSIDSIVNFIILKRAFAPLLTSKVRVLLKLLQIISSFLYPADI